MSKTMKEQNTIADLALKAHIKTLGKTAKQIRKELENLDSQFIDELNYIVPLK